MKDSRYLFFLVALLLFGCDSSAIAIEDDQPEIDLDFNYISGRIYSPNTMLDHPTTIRWFESGKLTLYKHSANDLGLFSLTLGTISTSGNFTQHGPLIKFFDGVTSGRFGTLSPDFDKPSTFLLIPSDRTSTAWVFATHESKQSFEVEGPSISKRYKYHSTNGSTTLRYEGGRDYVQYYDSTFVTFEPNGIYTFTTHSRIIRDGQPPPEGTLHVDLRSGAYAAFDQYVILKPGRVKMTLWTISGDELVNVHFGSSYLYKEVPFRDP